MVRVKTEWDRDSASENALRQVEFAGVANSGYAPPLEHRAR